MPLVRISLLKGKSREHVRAIADSVHQGLIDAYKIPPDDRFQLIDQHDPEDFIFDAGYLGIHRSSDVVFIHLVAGNCATRRRSRRSTRPSPTGWPSAPACGARTCRSC